MVAFIEIRSLGGVGGRTCVPWESLEEGVESLLKLSHESLLIRVSCCVGFQGTCVENRWACLIEL